MYSYNVSHRLQKQPPSLQSYSFPANSLPPPKSTYIPTSPPHIANLALMKMGASPSQPHMLTPGLSPATIPPLIQTPTVTLNPSLAIIRQSEIHALFLSKLPTPAVAAPLQRRAPWMAISSSQFHALCTPPSRQPIRSIRWSYMFIPHDRIYIAGRKSG